MCEDYSYTNIHHRLKPGTHSQVPTNFTKVRPGRWQHDSNLGLLVESLKLYPLSHRATTIRLDTNNFDNFSCTVLFTCLNIIYGINIALLTALTSVDIALITRSLHVYCRDIPTATRAKRVLKHFTFCFTKKTTHP